MIYKGAISRRVFVSFSCPFGFELFHADDFDDWNTISAFHAYPSAGGGCMMLNRYVYTNKGLASEGGVHMYLLHRSTLTSLSPYNSPISSTTLRQIDQADETLEEVKITLFSKTKIALMSIARDDTSGSVVLTEEGDKWFLRQGLSLLRVLASLSRTLEIFSLCNLFSRIVINTMYMAAVLREWLKAEYPPQFPHSRTKGNEQLLSRRLARHIKPRIREEGRRVQHEVFSCRCRMKSLAAKSFC